MVPSLECASSSIITVEEALKEGCLLAVKFFYMEMLHITSTHRPLLRTSHSVSYGLTQFHQLRQGKNMYIGDQYVFAMM